MSSRRTPNDVEPQRVCFEVMNARLERAVAFHRERGGAMNEWAVTCSVVTQLGLLRRLSFMTPDGLFVTVRLLPYEQSRPVEQLFGDVAIIVDLAFDDGHAAQGVAYFENKIVRKSGVRFRPGQPERYLSNSGHIYAMYFEKEKPTSVGAAGLAVDRHDTSVSVVPAGLILENRSHLPRASMTSLAAQLVQRTFIGFDLDLRPGAVGQAFRFGAQFYLHANVKAARNLTLLQSLESQFPDKRYIPDDVVLMWRNNERLRQVAVELGMEPSDLRTLLEPEIARDDRLRTLRMRDNERRGPELDGPSGGITR